MRLLDPQRGRGPQGSQNPGIPHIVPIPMGGGRTRAGRGDENPPTDQPTRERPPDGGDEAARQGTTGRQDAEADTGTEERAGGTSHPKSHPTGAAVATAVGSPVTTEPAPTKEERGGGAGQPITQTIVADLDALAGGTVREGPEPANENTQRK